MKWKSEEVEKQIKEKTHPEGIREKLGTVEAQKVGDLHCWNTKWLMQGQFANQRNCLGSLERKKFWNVVFDYQNFGDFILLLGQENKNPREQYQKKNLEIIGKLENDWSFWPFICVVYGLTEDSQEAIAVYLSTTFQCIYSTQITPSYFSTLQYFATCSINKIRGKSFSSFKVYFIGLSARSCHSSSRESGILTWQIGLI